MNQANQANQANKPQHTQTASGVLLASLVLPGLAALAALAPLTARAENAPEQTTIAVKYGSYRDSQPGLDRVSVSAPQIYVQAPIAGRWSVEASAVSDSVSGASPRWHTQVSGASRMSDQRHAGDLKLTHYLPRAAVSGSVAFSNEHDYASQAMGLDARWSSEDNNRTWTLGFGRANDRIDTTYRAGNTTAVNQRKRTTELMGGVTQVLSANDLVQFNLTRSLGTGYFDDPYKMLDKRPDQRNTWIALARWNHYVAAYDASLRTSYRYYTDTFGVQSHTAGVEWVQPVGRWTFTPGARYYSQSAAHFYVNPVFSANGQYDLGGTFAAASPLSYKSLDQRLSAFGALTLSLKASYAFTPHTSADVKVEDYQQKAALHLGQAGSAGLDPFNARFMQVGVTHRF